MDSLIMQKQIDLCFNPAFPYKQLDALRDVELSMGIKDRALYLGFLGSITIKDWIQNFKLWKKPYKQMKKLFFVHAGFLEIYKICREEIHTYIASHKAEFDSIHISGHSLGGAIGTLCFEDMAYLKETDVISAEITGLVTGSPRVFGFLGISIIRERCKGLLRLVNNNDIVPRIPFVWMMYSHAVKAIKKGRSCFLPLPSMIYDHDTQAYTHFLDSSRKENADNNWLLPRAKSIFTKIYIGIISLATTLLLVAYFIK